METNTPLVQSDMNLALMSRGYLHTLYVIQLGQGPRVFLAPRPQGWVCGQDNDALPGIFIMIIYMALISPTHNQCFLRVPMTTHVPRPCLAQFRNPEIIIKGLYLVKRGLAFLSPLNCTGTISKHNTWTGLSLSSKLYRDYK